MSNYTDNSLANDPNHIWFKLIKVIPAKSTVLDIGCSSGHLGQELIKQKQCEVDGVEPDEADAKSAAKVLGQVWSFNIEDQNNIDKISKKYDVLLFADVLEHLVDPVATLKMVRQLLKPGGTVVFSLPNMAHVSIRLSLLEGDFAYTETGLLDKTHLHFYNITSVRKMFNDAGMNLKKIDSSSFEYSDDLIQTRLSEMGLRAEKKGLEMLRGPEAAAFQYLGVADYGKKQSLAKFVPSTQAVQSDIQRMINELGEKQAVIGAKEAQIHSLSQEVHSTRLEIQKLTSSKTFKLAQKIAAPYRKANSIRKKRPQS